MKNQTQKLRFWFISDKRSTCLGLTILFIFMGFGCASTHKTTKTETTVTYPDGAVGNVGNGGNYYRTTTSSGDDQNRGVVKKSETTTTTETKAEHPGVLSSTLHAIGYVIALPFIIVGGLFKIIFGG